MAPAIAERRGRRKEESERGKEREGGGRQNRNRTRGESGEGGAGLRTDHHRLIYNAGGVTEFTIKIPRSAALMDRRAPRNAGDDSGIFK